MTKIAVTGATGRLGQPLQLTASVELKTCGSAELRIAAFVQRHAYESRRGAGQATTGVETVERTGHCTSCEPELFFSHRRDRGRTGRQGVIAYIR